MQHERAGLGGLVHHQAVDFVGVWMGQAIQDPKHRGSLVLSMVEHLLFPNSIVGERVHG